MLYENIWKYGTSLEENIIGDQRIKTNTLGLNHNNNQHCHIIFRETAETLKSDFLLERISDQEEWTTLDLETLSIKKFPWISQNYCTDCISTHYSTVLACTKYCTMQTIL